VSPDLRSRLAPAALVAALLVATSTAFVVTEKLKLTRNPIVGPRVDKIFSPVCDCATDTATISFRLRRPDRVSLEIVDSDGDVVRELARNSRQGRALTSYVWDGRDGAGNVVREGSYRPRVHLDDERRTIVMPNPIRVDVSPPRVESFTARPLVISPDGDGRFDRAKIRYRVSERSVVELYVDGVRALRRLGTRTTGTMDWFGVAGGEPLPQGRYVLRLVARDVAGNLGPRSGSRTVTIRFLALGRERVVAAPGARFAILALSQARRLRWTLAGRSGVARPGTLRLSAPNDPGRYVLRVAANGHVERAVVVVRTETP
jgi:FlgD Ig-like domain